MPDTGPLEVNLDLEKLKTIKDQGDIQNSVVLRSWSLISEVLVHAPPRYLHIIVQLPQSTSHHCLSSSMYTYMKNGHMEFVNKFPEDTGPGQLWSESIATEPWVATYVLQPYSPTGYVTWWVEGSCIYAGYVLHRAGLF